MLDLGPWGARIAPMLRWSYTTPTFGAFAYAPMLPANHQRFAVLLGSYNTGIEYQFTRVAPTARGSILVHANTGMGCLVRYCDIGNLIWEPLWAISQAGVSVAVGLVEFTLPQEGWEHIWSQSAQLPAPR